ncbi:MAG: AGE family epimerase/isomerase [Tessaracoccus sp.]|uniref:AGE family epimerase/isomerase n=1 Tax=Tessaracoccus sp. TaxID=1971211 RepID=UPI001ED2A16D|nr:AGE family epimerase/isomerase [Tessaracoccus sp.]MBK7820205.1 AGE family epimerase/isomerase [Tessaracoccus sp.]
MTTIDRATHRSWLFAHFEHLLDFGRRTPVEGGGAAWLDDDGAPIPEEGAQTWITCRTVHTYSLGALLGLPGARPIAQAALDGLTGRMRDAEGGGWHGQVGGVVPEPAVKAAYQHAFVVLAASSGVLAGLDGAQPLLSEALQVMEERFWDEEYGRVVDTWNEDFTELDPYRGINANMHTVEAFLAAADVTGDRLWLERAARIGVFAAESAKANGWRLPEHFDAEWNALLEFNADRPADPFKPYGATVGHGLEWARLLLNLEAAGAEGADWAEAAVALFDCAVEDGWDEEIGGFVYTTDWTGNPVVPDRMHWVVAEAIGAAATLWRRTGDDRYAELYQRYWDYADAHLIDRERGSWRHQLDGENHPADTTWRGKPDLYHAAQATLIPQLPLAPTMASAIARNLWEPAS